MPGRFVSAISSRRAQHDAGGLSVRVPRASSILGLVEMPSGSPPAASTASSNSGRSAGAKPSRSRSMRSVRSSSAS